MQGIKTSEETKVIILNQYQQGLSRKQIRELHNISEQTISNLLKTSNIKPRRQTFFLEQELDIVNLYLNTEQSSTEIAKQFNTDRTVIRKVLNRHNINRNYLRKNRLIKNNPFIDIENPETQYWLGILASDGYIQDRSLNNSLDNRVGYVIGLVNCKDSYILNDFINFTKSNLKIYKSKNPKSVIAKSTVSFSSKLTYDYLFELGFTPNKSKTLKIKFNITWDFIRGVLDGDGWVYLVPNTNGCKLGICSASIEFINQLQEFFIKEGFNFSLYKESKTGMYRLSLTKQESIYNLYNKLYNKDLPCIIRKKDNMKKVADYYFNKVNDMIRA